ncbi:hypothetical protein L1987_89440 [Smallanthus sonchifolius]|nr:hypothetical protein L1987_89440 [Smallanthus sonchifolius]
MYPSYFEESRFSIPTVKTPELNSDRVHDPSRLLLVESIKKACDQCSDQFSITADEYDKMIDQIYAGQPGDMIVVAPDPKDIVVIIALTELLFDLCIYQKYTEEERVKSKTDEYKHLNRYHSNLIDMGRTNHDVEPFNDINGMSFISLFGMHCKIVSVGPGDGQIECIGQFGVSVDIDTKNLIFHHQFDKYMLTTKKEHEMPLLFFYLESLLLSGCVGTPDRIKKLQWVLVSSPHARGNLDRIICSLFQARFPSTSRAFPSLSQSAGEGSSRAPLTSEDLPLLSQLRRDFIEGVPTEDSDRIGIINSTSAVPGAAERDALAVEAKKGIEVRLA